MSHGVGATLSVEVQCACRALKGPGSLERVEFMMTHNGLLLQHVSSTIASGTKLYSLLLFLDLSKLLNHHLFVYFLCKMSLIVLREQHQQNLVVGYGIHM